MTTAYTQITVVTEKDEKIVFEYAYDGEQYEVGPVVSQFSGNYFVDGASCLTLAVDQIVSSTIDFAGQINVFLDARSIEYLSHGAGYSTAVTAHFQEA